jgi:hypothetical protein
MQPKNQSTGIAGKLPIVSALATLVLSGIVYLIALALPAYNLANNDPFIGVMVLFLGWMGPFVNGAGNPIGWYANVFLFFGWGAMLLGKFRPLAIAAVIALGVGLLIALTAFGVTQLPVNEAGTTARATIGAGAYAWLASFAIALLGSIATAALAFITAQRAPQKIA